MGEIIEPGTNTTGSGGYGIPPQVFSLNREWKTHYGLYIQSPSTIWEDNVNILTLVGKEETITLLCDKQGNLTCKREGNK